MVKKNREFTTLEGIALSLIIIVAISWLSILTFVISELYPYVFIIFSLTSLFIAGGLIIIEQKRKNSKL